MELHGLSYEHVSSVCARLWAKYLKSQDALALKAILCVPGALFELSQYSPLRQQEAQLIEGGSTQQDQPAPPFAQQRPPGAQGRLPLENKKPDFAFLATLLLLAQAEGEAEPEKSLISLPAFQDAVWLSLHQGDSSTTPDNQYILPIFLTIVMLALSVLAALISYVASITPYIALLPSIGLGPIIGVLVVMALDEKKQTPPPAPKHHFLAAPMRTLEQSHKRLANVSEALARRSMELTAQRASHGSAHKALTGLVRRHRLSKDSADPIAPEEKQRLGQPGRGGSLDAQTRDLRRTSRSKLKGLDSFDPAGMERPRGSLDMQNKYDPRSSLDALGGHYGRGSSFEDRRRPHSIREHTRSPKNHSSIPENQASPQEPQQLKVPADQPTAHELHHQQQQEPQQQQQQLQSDEASGSPFMLGSAQQQQQQQQQLQGGGASGSPFMLGAQQQEQQQEGGQGGDVGGLHRQESQQEARPPSAAPPRAGPEKAMSRSLDLPLPGSTQNAQQNEDRGSKPSKLRQRLSLDSHSVFGSAVWKGGAKPRAMSRRHSSSMSMTSSNESSDAVSNPFDVRARHIREAELKERAGKVLAVLLAPPHELSIAEVRELYDELEGDELQYVPAITPDGDSEAERELEELIKAQKAREQEAAKRALEAAANPADALEEAAREAAEQEMRRRREHDDAVWAMQEHFRPSDTGRKAYGSTPWKPKQQELEEARAEMEHKQAKARAEWEAHQLKPAQGPMLRSVMGDRELYYQMSVAADDDDDAPIIRHSPLVEEQLAAARAEAEAEAAEAQRRADESGAEALRVQQAKEAAQAAKAGTNIPTNITGSSALQGSTPLPTATPHSPPIPNPPLPPGHQNHAAPLSAPLPAATTPPSTHSPAQHTSQAPPHTQHQIPPHTHQGPPSHSVQGGPPKDSLSTSASSAVSSTKPSSSTTSTAPRTHSKGSSISSAGPSGRTSSAGFGKLSSSMLGVLGGSGRSGLGSKGRAGSGTGSGNVSGGANAGSSSDKNAGKAGSAAKGNVSGGADAGSSSDKSTGKAGSAAKSSKGPGLKLFRKLSKGFS